MPIFARAKLVIHDDCLSFSPGSRYPGVPYAKLNYSGPHPEKVYPEIKKLLSSVMNVDERDIQEKEVNWSRLESTEKFSVKMEAFKDMDRFTYMHIEVEVKGYVKPSKEFEKEGECKIKLETHLRTEYPQETLLQRTLFYEFFRLLFHKFLYKSTRIRYLEQCRELSLKFLLELRKFLNILGGA